MIFIDYKNNPPSEELIKEGQKLTQQLLALPENKRKEFIERNKFYWGKLKKHLSSLSYGKCWYTEAHDIASVYHVDHFRPKNETRKLKKDCHIETDNNDEAYWWLAFAWENYRLCGDIPNITKNAYFPLRKGSPIAKNVDDLDKEWIGLLDPTDYMDVMLLTFGEDGRAYPACSDDSSWDAQRVTLSICVYDLNSAALVDARIEIQNQCKRRVNRIMRLIQDKDNNYNPLVREEIREQVCALKKMVEPRSELSAVAKKYIQGRTETFIKNIL